MAFVKMRRERSRDFQNPRNWEEEIISVSIEPCDLKEDPLGFRAIFELDQHKVRVEKQRNFVIGASFLAKRKRNLDKAGYKAPWTCRAIALIEGKMGKTLPVVLA